jgi:hypothetical protein
MTKINDDQISKGEDEKEKRRSKASMKKMKKMEKKKTIKITNGED